jgi:tripartite-type tricarboxylate transporter receptor subunit TctC
VRLIVPFPPGGSNDILGRFIAAKLTERLGQQVIVDNRPGADGIIGTDLAARATPDGYTLLIVSTSYTMNPGIHKKLPFDPIKDLAPIAMIGTGPNAIVVNPGFPVKTVKDLVAAAKAKPGQINYASSGIGGFNHFGGELFKSTAGIDMTHVPYKGGGPAMVDIIAGHVPVLFSTLTQVLPYQRSGKLRVIATGGRKRAPALPDVPTVIESGVNYEVTIWWGVLGPKGLPPALANGLNATVAKILGEPETQKRLAAEAAEPMVVSPGEFGKIIEKDIAKWTKVARDAKMEAH